MDQNKGEYLLRGINDVASERMRQIEVEGFSAARDDQYEGGTLAVAGACYGVHAAWSLSGDGAGQVLEGVPQWWPWGPDTWNPSDPRSNLVKAAALLIAEIDRYDREHDAKSRVYYGVGPESGGTSKPSQKGDAPTSGDQAA